MLKTVSTLFAVLRLVGRERGLDRLDILVVDFVQALGAELR
jgi:hypothetical protein